YLPKGSDLSVHGPGILDNIAAELNARPRKRLDWDTPAEALEKLLSTHEKTRLRRPPEVAPTT
ncbi:MAG: IS30 family transposase, partial [Dermatophilaceae bacterium]